jgi:hypothetical protein
MDFPVFPPVKRINNKMIRFHFIFEEIVKRQNRDPEWQEGFAPLSEI